MLLRWIRGQARAKTDFADNGSRCQGYFGDNLVPRNRQFAVGRSCNKTGSLQNLKIVMDVLIVALHSPGQSPYANGSDLVNNLEHIQPPGVRTLSIVARSSK